MLSIERSAPGNDPAAILKGKESATSHILGRRKEKDRGKERQRCPKHRSVSVHGS